MKTFKIIPLVAILILVGFTATAQDDFYPSSSKKKKDKNEAPSIVKDNEVIDDGSYSTATDYYYDVREREAQEAYNRKMGITDSTTYYEDEEGNVRITNNYYNGDNYNFENEYYDYEYSSRIRRFHRPTGRYGYYDDYYTNYYYYNYDPFFYGTSLYMSYGWWYPRPWGWNVGWGYGGGWGMGMGWGYGGGWGYPGWGWGGGFYGSSYWMGYNHGYNDGWCASNNYYNSYDGNSHYYGKRGVNSSTNSYGGRGAESGNASNTNTGKKALSFGEKYEAAVKSNPSLNNGAINNSPKNGINKPITTTKPEGNYTNPTPTKNNGYVAPSPRTPTTNPSNQPNQPNQPVKQPTTRPTYQPKPQPNTQPNTQPRSQPRSNNNKPSYTSPKPNTKPSYNSPSPSSKPSYSAPSRGGGSSGGSYKGGSSGGGSRPSGGGGGRSPR